MKELESVADKVVLLAHGRVRADGAISDIVSGYPSLEYAYLRTDQEGDGMNGTAGRVETSARALPLCSDSWRGSTTR